MGLDFLDGLLLKRMVLAATVHLQENRQAVDALNVFPVPDGDTGMNMSMTMNAAAREVERCGDESVAEVAQAVAQGSLMGARGNSGVILSQLFRGFAKAVDGRKKISPAELARAFQEGVETAYKAVMKPVEGTILTVARESARTAMAAARTGGDIIAVLKASLDQAEATLERTPELLPVLKKAGVVDSGGKGLCFILSAYLQSAQGLSPVPSGAVAPTESKRVEFTITEEISDIRFPYDIEFFIRDPRVGENAIRAHLEAWCGKGRGDSLIVIGAGKVVKVHVHAENPGPVLEYCAAQGELFEIVIKNMREQHDELVDPEGHRAGEVSAPGSEAPEADEPVDSAVVVVAAGEGLADIFRSLGAAEIVQGGQTMNPSTEDLLMAMRRTRARHVYVLPNNKNIILTAQQCATLTDQTVHVIPSRSIPQGIAALLAWQPEQEPEKSVRAMNRALDTVRTGEVTFAVRSTTFGDLVINEGDTLGLADGQIKIVGRDYEQVALDLLHQLVGDESEVITIYFGESVSEESAAALGDRVRQTWPECEVETLAGRQPLYHYILSVE